MKPGYVKTRLQCRAKVPPAEATAALKLKPDQAEVTSSGVGSSQAEAVHSERYFAEASSSSSQVHKGVIDLSSSPGERWSTPNLKLSLSKQPAAGRGRPVHVQEQEHAKLSNTLTKNQESSGTLASNSRFMGRNFQARPKQNYVIPFEVPVFNAQDKKLDGLGRTLSKVLRHQAVEYNIKIRSNGYCKVDDLLRLPVRTRAGLPLMSHTVDDVKKVVEEDPKRRFSIIVENGELYVRANQGHSMKAVLSHELLKEISDAKEVPVCVHGTMQVNLPSIMATGLNRMGRNHVHFATGPPNEEGVVSGMRQACDALIYLDVKKALADGMKLYMSENKVLLTEGFGGVVPPAYFEKVLHWPTMNAIRRA